MKEEIRAMLESRGVTPAKALGQNFLTDENALRRIAALAENARFVLEIGAGTGHLTALLCERAEKVVTVEIDKTLSPVLRETVTASNHEFLWQDILKTDLAAVRAQAFDGEPFTVVGNLPYYITSDIIDLICRAADLLEGAILMVQKEAAQRLTAPPGQKNYRASSALTRYYFEIARAFDVPPHCFYPAPHVDSSVITLTPRSARALARDREAAFAAFVRRAFGARRKKITHLTPGGEIKADFAERCLAAGIDPAARCETLSPETLAALFTLTERSI